MRCNSLLLALTLIAGTVGASSAAPLGDTTRSSAPALSTITNLQEAYVRMHRCCHYSWRLRHVVCSPRPIWQACPRY